MPQVMPSGNKWPERFPVPAHFNFQLSAFQLLHGGGPQGQSTMLEPGMDQSLWPVLPPSARART
jgi:hypothetical protein